MTRKNFPKRAYKKSPISLAILSLFLVSVVNAADVRLSGPIHDSVSQEGNIEIEVASGQALDFGTNSEILIESKNGNVSVIGNSQLEGSQSGVAFDVGNGKTLTVNAAQDFVVSVTTSGDTFGDAGGVFVRAGGEMDFSVTGNVSISAKQLNADPEIHQVRGITSAGISSGYVGGNLVITTEGYGAQGIQADQTSTELDLNVVGAADISATTLGTYDVYGVVNQSQGVLNLHADAIDINVDHLSLAESTFGPAWAVGAGNYAFGTGGITTIASTSNINVTGRTEIAELYGIMSLAFGGEGEVEVNASNDIVVDVESSQGTVYGVMTYGDYTSANVTAVNGNNLVKAAYCTQAEGSGTLGNDGFGQSFAVYAEGVNITQLFAGKANQLFGALYAASGATVGLTGDMNAIASFAVIEGAGDLGLDKGSVISALYAEGEATSVTLTGQNILTTYADNTNEAQLERVVWAYDGADVTLDGPVLISTNRYEISSNSLDIAVAAGTATELSEAHFAGSLSEEKVANVTINYASGQAGSVNAITGDILAGYAGHVSIEPHDSEASIVVEGNLLAGNGGELKLSLGKNGVLAGRSDDYFDAGDGTTYSHIEFFDPAFSSNILRRGSITLEMSEGSRWYVRDQSWLTNLEGNSGTIYLTEGTHGSDALHIQHISGQHTFVMNLSHDSEVQSDMLYINEVGEGAETQLLRVDSIEGLENMTDGDRIRFATVNSSQLKFVVDKPAEVPDARTLVRDIGFYDVSFLLEAEDRQSSPSDDNYDGDGLDATKPGARYVDNYYGNDEEAANWYLVRDAGHDEVSDGGEAILATARAAYWNAVEIDRLNKRLGDMRHAGGAKDGLWVRMRHDRIGTDAGTGDFRTHNTTYQFGYDHTLASDDGQRLFGAAIDYMEADTTYRNVDGTGGTDRFGITAYMTWLGDNGWYYDVVGRWGILSNSMRILNGSGSLVETDYDNHVLAASLEVGRKWTMPDTAWFVEPQAQVQFAMVTEASYSTNQGTRVDQDQINSAITRLGIRVGREFGDSAHGSFYAKADWLKEWHGHQGMRVTDATTGGVMTDASFENKGDWFDVGFGVASAISKSTYFFADAEYVFGNNFENTWSFNAGVRWMFR